MLSTQQISLIQSYRDKAYVSNILCEECSNYYSKLKSFVNIPLILTSSLMTIFNSSSFASEDMKIPNIVCNSMTALLLSLISNFKLSEKFNNFKSIANKFNKLTSSIENKLTNDIENITIEQINAIILEYDNLNEAIEFQFPDFIKERVKKKFNGKRIMPNILNCVTDYQRNSSTTLPDTPLHIAV